MSLRNELLQYMDAFAISRNAYPHTRGWRRNYCLCFHADIASKRADEHFKINVSCRCKIAKINYVCVIIIKWNICDMHRPLIIGNGGGVAQESDVGNKNV